MKKQLSIFVDESGNVGFNSEGASDFYIISMIFHNQMDDITNQLNKVKSEKTFHIGPLIAGKEIYKGLSIQERQKSLNKMLIFTSILPITQKTFIYNKKRFHDDKHKLLNAISKDLCFFLIEKRDYFLSFDEIIIYYDGGQQIVSKALTLAFNKEEYKVVFKQKVRPDKYRLFQVADFISTITLINAKLSTFKKMSKTESTFMNRRHLKNVYLRTINKKEFK